MSTTLYKPQLLPSNLSHKTGVALSGSGFLFPAHVGAITAIVESGLSITNVAGTSGGGLVAALFASGMTPNEMYGIISKTDFSVMMKYKLWGWWNGLCNPNPLYDFMKEHTNGIRFRETQIPLTLMSSNLVTQSPFEFSTKSTPSALLATGARATSSIPYIYPAVQYNNAVLVDGGIVNNIPVEKLVPNQMRIGVDIVEAADNQPPAGLISYTKKIINTMLKNSEEAQITLANVEKAFIVRVSVTGSFLNNHMTQKQIMDLFEAGYKQTINNINNIKGLISHD